MLTFIMDYDELLALVANARWFVGYYVRKDIGGGKYRVKTNYPWIQA